MIDERVEKLGNRLGLVPAELLDVRDALDRTPSYYGREYLETLTCRERFKDMTT